MSETPPPQFSQYPRPSYMQSPNGRPPGVYLDDISAAWGMVRQDLPTWLAASLIQVFASMVLGAVSNFVQYGGSLVPPPNYRQAPEDVFLSLGLSLCGGVVTTTLMAGMYHMGVKQARGESIAVADMFAGFGRLGSMIGAYILTTIITMVSFMLCLVPGIFMTGALAFVYLLVIEQKLGPVEAISKSFETLKKHAWMMFCLIFVVGLLVALGLCACGVGILFTIPIFAAIMGLHYTYFFPQVPGGQQFGIPNPYNP